MTEEYLHYTKIDALFEKPCGETVSECVAHERITERTLSPGDPDRLADCVV